MIEATREPIPITAAQQKLRRDGLGYVWDVLEHRLELRADYVGARSDEMHAEVTVRHMGRHLHMARFNLSSSTSRGTLRRALEEATRGVQIPWATLIEQFCVGVLLREREGEATRYTAEAPKRRLTYLVDDLVIKGKTNMLFAPGGSGKGYLSVGLCCATVSKRGLGDLSVMEARPFYFDWEDDFDTFEDRLNAVATGMDTSVPRIPYRRMRGLAADRINEMARAIAEEGADFGIIDSFSAAGGTVSERVTWDTIAHRLFDALDLIPNMTWLIIDHVKGEEVRKDPTGKAFGSIQKMNRVRNAWEMRSEQEEGSRDVHMRLFHAKWNHTGKKKPKGLLLAFDDDKVVFHPEDPKLPLGRPTASLADKIAMELDRGPLSTGVLAVSLKVDPAAIRTELSRSRGRFMRDERGFIGLRRDDESLDEDVPW